MVKTKVLFFVGLIFSLSSFSMEGPNSCKDQPRTRLGHHTTPSQDGHVGLPNPAAGFCERHKGTYDLKRGVCKFADETECGAWPFVNGDCAPGVCRTWSDSENVCAVLVASEGCDAGASEGTTTGDCADNCATAQSDCADNCVTAQSDCADNCATTQSDCADNCATVQAGCADNCVDACATAQSGCGDNCATVQASHHCDCGAACAEDCVCASRGCCQTGAGQTPAQADCTCQGDCACSTAAPVVGGGCQE